MKKMDRIISQKKPYNVSVAEPHQGDAQLHYGTSCYPEMTNEMTNEMTEIEQQ